MRVIESVPQSEIVYGKSYYVVRYMNAMGQQMGPIRKNDWRKVVITAENVGNYFGSPNGKYYVQPVK